MGFVAEVVFVCQSSHLSRPNEIFVGFEKYKQINK